MTAPELKPTAVLIAALTADDAVPPPDAAAGAADLKRLIAEHDGVPVDMPGRRVGAQFRSAFAAVSCAMALQRATRDAAADLRIGIDFGDTLSNGETIVGDGVYVAARLQAMADPGQVCVSGAIHERVTGRAGVAFVDLGAQSLAQNAAAVQVYCIEPEPDDDGTDLARDPAAAPPGQAVPGLAPFELDPAGRSQNADAERQVQRGFWLHHRNNRTDNEEAQRLFWAALELDPNHAPAAAGLALCLLEERQRNWTAEPGRALIKADALARRAVALEPKYAFGRAALGEISLFRNDPDKALAEAGEALALQPAFADAHSLMGHVLLCDGLFDRALTTLDQALERDPSERLQAKVLPGLAAIYYQLRRYQHAERIAERAAGVCGDHWLVRQILAASRGQLGYRSAGSALAGIHDAEPQVSRREFATRLYFRDSVHRDHVDQGLQKAGWEEAMKW